GLSGMLLMLVTGIPIYVCSTASVPIAVGLIISGFSPGAVLVFLIAGPATNAASLSALVKIIGKKETIIYLLSLMITALAIGFVTDYFNIAQGIQVYAQEAHEHLGLVEHTSAVILLLLMSSKLFTIFKRKASVDGQVKTETKKPCCCSEKKD
ncbi:MAG: permease, partial [Lentisphaeria bacterium]|nr:permease [Lentisphaeria bacterium]